MPVLFLHNKNVNSWWSGLRKYFAQDWRSILFVVALGTILDDHFELFKAMHGYAFVAFGNLVARSEDGRPRETGRLNASRNGRVAVVLIDRHTYESSYFEQSPLNRCKLKDHLTNIYRARPRLVAIDLDISPAFWIREEKNSLSEPNVAYAKYNEDCEESLYLLVKAHSLETVLMAPIAVSNETHKEAIGIWREGMAKSGVTFGDVDIEVRYGLALENSTSSNAFAREVERRLGEASLNGHDSMLDPRKFRTEFLEVIHLNDLKHSENFPQIKEPSKTYFSDLTARTVFFGGGFDDTDSYLTPAGEIYGVEWHAASYLSLKEPITKEKKLLAVLIDLLFGVISGICFSVLWRQYIDMRLSSNVRHQQLACFSVLGLLFLVLGMMFLMIGAAYRALLHLGVWASPIPIVVGMLIDSLVLGSVTTFLERAHGDEPSTEEAPAATGRHLVSVIALRRIFMGSATSSLALSQTDVLAVSEVQRPTDRLSAIVFTMRRLVCYGVIFWGLVLVIKD